MACFNIGLCPERLHSILGMTVENGPAPASLPEGERAYSWLFTARLHITRPSDPTQECANIPATVFEDVLARRSDYQNAVLKRLEVLSFSFNPEWSRLLPGDLLSVDGLVVHINQLRRSSVAGPDHWRIRWPAHLELCAGSDRGDALSAVSHAPTGFLCVNDGNHFRIARNG